MFWASVDIQTPLMQEKVDVTQTKGSGIRVVCGCIFSWS
jgi:hypothetical protein